MDKALGRTKILENLTELHSWFKVNTKSPSTTPAAYIRLLSQSCLNLSNPTMHMNTLIKPHPCVHVRHAAHPSWASGDLN